MSRRFVIHLSTGGHLGSFQMFAIVNSTAMNIEVYIYTYNTHRDVLVFQDP